MEYRGGDHFYIIRRSVYVKGYTTLLTSWSHCISLSQDAALTRGVAQYGAGSWTEIAAALLPGRTGLKCQHRWEHTLNPAIKKGKWSAQEVYRSTFNATVVLFLTCPAVSCLCCAARSRPMGWGTGRRWRPTLRAAHPDHVDVHGRVISTRYHSCAIAVYSYIIVFLSVYSARYHCSRPPTGSVREWHQGAEAACPCCSPPTITTGGKEAVCAVWLW